MITNALSVSAMSTGASSRPYKLTRKGISNEEAPIPGKPEMGAPMKIRFLVPRGSPAATQLNIPASEIYHVLFILAMGSNPTWSPIPAIS